ASQGIGRRYLLHELVGSGGMGTVYRATDRLTQQIVALKRVNASPDQLEFGSKAEGINNLLAIANEFRTLASLRHPNIVSVLDYGFDEDHQPYFTMDLEENASTILEAGDGEPLAVQIELL